MSSIHGYSGNVPTQSDTSNYGLLDVNNYNLLKRRNQISLVNLPPIPSGMTLRFFLDASEPTSYSGSGSTWNDISGNNRNATMYNVNFTSSSPSYFNLSNTFSFSLPTNSLASNLTVFWAMQTNDTQSLMITSNGSTDYLGAYSSGNGYYHSNVSGNRTLYINTSTASTLYSSIRGATSRLVTISDCDFNFTNQQYIFNTYGSFQFGDGKLYAIGAYNGNLTSADVTALHNFFNEKGYIGI